MAGDAPRPASLLEVGRTVLAAFLGVRRRADHDHSAPRIRPVHLAIVAIALVALFIFTLVTIARLVTGS